MAAGHQWLTPIILVTQEDHGSKLAQANSLQYLILKERNPSQKRTGRVAQGIDTEFKPQY
jgi:hypothetical protein